jgi:3-oxoacyl-(acyl-carrier-protein) synthase/short-subunit dehydrogenase
MNLNVDMEDFISGIHNQNNLVQKKPVSTTDIAIIGISAKIGAAENVSEFWNCISNGYDLIDIFPPARQKDIDKYLKTSFGKEKNSFIEMAYLNNIDLFDAGLFNMTPVEAELMDPVQRIFLECMLTASEDAGYGGNRLFGSKTGVYVGCNSNTSDNYFSMISALSPSKMGLALAGNLNSIVASRFSYLFNLRGPAEVIDTACSSSLVAVHTACQAIRNGEVDMAFAGGIKIGLIPRTANNENDIGITSSSGRTKTFDHEADGTGAGEGSGVVLLKPLYRALEDGDNIHAIIKGTATNQDGTSVGITAPNSQAQTEVLLAAWEDAKISPLSLQYIEAHGTATNLGDPIEIESITKAFQRYTERTQFCAVGSVKTNVGHLDCAAGIAGLINAVMMLKNKKIPPNIHFRSGNRKIDFINSPVYINDRLKPWEQGQMPRRCGVSSFGISGTNCHVVLEEAPDISEVHHDKDSGYQILTVSAKNRKSVDRILDSYSKWLKGHKDASLRDVCFTANVGRGHYNCRMAIVIKEGSELNPNEICSGSNLENVCYREFQISTNNEIYNKEGFITIQQKAELTRKSKEVTADILSEKSQEKRKLMLKELAELYISGADVDWDMLYKDNSCRKLSIPTYPFDYKRYWISAEKGITGASRMSNKEYEKRLHPLLDQCLVDSMEVVVFSRRINIDNCWELKEHVIGRNHVLPGTAFVEMVREAGSRFYKTDSIEIEELLFLMPFTCNEGEQREIQIIGKNTNDCIEIGIVSAEVYEGEKTWISHVIAKIRKTLPSVIEKYDIDEIIERCPDTLEVYSEGHSQNGHVTVTDRWKTNRMVHFSGTELVAKFELSEEYHSGLKDYYLYPPLLDGAVNVGNIFTKSGFCLPLSYGKAKFYKPLPGRFYSYLRMKNSQNSDQITILDICIISDGGEVIAEIDDYTLKEVDEQEMSRVKGEMLYSVKWIEGEKLNSADVNLFSGRSVLVIRTEAQQDDRICKMIQSLNTKILIDVVVSDEFKQMDSHRYKVRCCEEDFGEVFEDLSERHIDYVFHIAAAGKKNEDTLEDLHCSVDMGIKSMFVFLQSIAKHQVKVKNITACIDSSVTVNGAEEEIKPLNRALSGMIKSASKEYDNIHFKIIDLDEQTDSRAVLDEVLLGNDTILTAYRNNCRFIECFSELVQSERKKVSIKDEGVYVVTGGLGGVGLVIAQQLAKMNGNVKIALLNRSGVPKEIRTEKDERTIKAIDGFFEITGKTDSLEIISVDISDTESLNREISRLRDKYGKINGVVHCAGVSGKGFLLKKTWGDFEDVLRAKVYGTWIMDKVTENDDLDFFIMCSSLSSIFSSSGQSDYSAANSYIDSFAEKRSKRNKNTLAINWTGWKETGMAVDYKVNQAESLFKFIDNSRGQEAFEYVLGCSQSRIIVGELNYEMIQKSRVFLDDLITFSNSIENKLRQYQNVHDSEDEQSDVKINVVGKSNGDITPTEYQVARAVARTLKFEEVNIYDKFFEMGGDSLLAASFKKELDKLFPGVVDITDVFTYVSVYEMAKYIDSLINTPQQALPEDNKVQSDDELRDLLMKLNSGSIDIEEAEKRLL